MPLKKLIAADLPLVASDRQLVQIIDRVKELVGLAKRPVNSNSTISLKVVATTINQQMIREITVISVRAARQVVKITPKQCRC